MSHVSDFCTCAYVCTNEELNDLYPSPRNFVRVIKSRRMRWAGHVARVGERRDVYRVMVGKPGGKDTTWETQAYSAGSGMWCYGLDRAGSGYGQVAGTCECGNERSFSIKRGEFLD